MSNFILYLFHSAVILTVLYLVYWLFLRKDTFFHVNRFYLVSSLLLSLVMPMIDFRFLSLSHAAPLVVMLDPVIITPEKIQKAASLNLSWFQVAGVVYITGVIIFSLRFIIQIVQLLSIVKRNKITHQEGANLVFVDKGYSPFSFFNLIFIRKEYYINGKLTPVIEHEKIHIRQHHTLDLILMEIIIILQWFNPFAWFLGRSVKSVHEFLADEGVLKKGFLKTDYQALILNEAMGLQVNNLTNNFNVSLLKTRIKMMTKTRSASWALMKVGFAIPALLVVLFLFTSGSTGNLYAQDTQQKKATEEKSAAQYRPTEEEPAYEVVKTMPEYPGGFDAMVNYLASNIKYPPEAKTKGTQGTVFVTFIVEKDGSVTHVKILQGIGDGCDEESIRVVKGMPKWSPGKNDNDQPVRVVFNLPIKYKLDNKKGGKE